MPKLTVQVRTGDDLRDLLTRGESPAWVIADDRIQEITHVQVVNFEGTQMIEGVFDCNASSRTDDGRLCYGFWMVGSSTVTSNLMGGIQYDILTDSRTDLEVARCPRLKFCLKYSRCPAWIKSDSSNSWPKNSNVTTAV